jgi:microfibrillar-associated protein 1
MPPPMPNPAKRMTAQPSRPVARYRPGKPVHEEDSSEEESEEEQQQQKPQPKKTAASSAPSRPTAHAAEESSDEEGFVTDPEDEDDGGVHIPQAAARPEGRPIPTEKRPDLPVGDSASGSESEDDSEDDESESEESSSESDAPARKFQRPTFIKKSQRNGESATPAPTSTVTNAASEDVETEDAKARRRAETDFLISEKINRDNLARAQGRRAWDDDDALDPDAMVDDTDDVDPEAEHAAWRLRELQRLKRDREALIAREKEIEETERRRNLTAEEREAEDRAFLDKQKEEKDGRGQTGFLAKYHHKGAFFQDSEAAEELKKRDVMGARFEDEVDKSTLPEYMRIRDLNKLGKKGGTRYKDLRNEDTGGFGHDVSRWKGAMGAGGPRQQDRMNLGDVDPRFLPDDDRHGPTSSGANSAPLGPRRERRKSRSRSPARRDDGRRRRSYSRSRSPRRKRSPSPDRYRSDDKRRRVET